MIVVERMPRSERFIKKNYVVFWNLGSATTTTRIRASSTRMSR
jgi:hypothetical protein